MARPTMTSRQRVLCTLNHQEPDRVPFNLALTVDIYERLRRHLGLPPDPDVRPGIWTDVLLKTDLVEAMRLDICTVSLNAPAHWSPRLGENGLVYDEWGVGRRKVVRADGSYYMEMVEHPLADATLADVHAYPWPDPLDPGRTEALRQKVKWLRDQTDKAIMAKFSNAIWEQSWWLRGLEQWMLDLVLNPEIACAIMDHVCAVAVGTATAGLEAAGDLIDIYRLSGEDLGTQLGPMISPATFEHLVRPRFERLWTAIKRMLGERNPNARLMLHSCGNVRPFIPAWIGMGLDILDPVQPRAQGMEPERLKRDFGDRLAFHGGIDIQHVLPFGTVDDVKYHVRDYIRALAPGGGYIVAPAHNVQSDVPPANLVAIRDAIEEYGYYPIAV